MITVRKSNERGHADHGWLNTYHTFSFADYYDPRHMGFSSLRVINEDFVAPGRGFGTHPHNDMEIITYVLEGSLSHQDSMGNGSTIVPGEVQRMSAGTGVLHSEKNDSRGDSVHLLQIWIQPSKKGVTPSYEQKFFGDEEKQGKLRLIASPDGADGSVSIHQNAKLFATLLSNGEQVEHPLNAGRSAYVQVARGSIQLNGQILSAGDGAEIRSEDSIRLSNTNGKKAEVLLFDLP